MVQLASHSTLRSSSARSGTFDDMGARQAVGRRGNAEIAILGIAAQPLLERIRAVVAGDKGLLLRSRFRLCRLELRCGLDFVRAVILRRADDLPAGLAGFRVLRIALAMRLSFPIRECSGRV
jgi:hypothetical protein